MGPFVGVVLTGGASLRSQEGAEEVPLLKLGGVPLVDRTRVSLLDSGVEEVFVATSPRTPETSRHCQLTGAPWVATPGEGTPSDLQHVSQRWPRILAVRTDLPFLRPSTLARFLEHLRTGPVTSVTGLLPALLSPGSWSPSSAWPEPLPGLGPCAEVGVFAVDRGAIGPSEPYVFLDGWLSYRIRQAKDLPRAEALRRRFESGAEPPRRTD